jgi:isopentenyl-diphosphate delta-isomerase
MLNFLKKTKLHPYRAFSSGLSMAPGVEAALRAKYNMKDSSLDRYLQEQVIIVDEHDRFLGNLSLLESHLVENADQRNIIHRAFSVFIFNQKNELLLQQRSDGKMAFPGMWTNSVCSHPLFNFNEHADLLNGTKAGAKRRTNDELNQDLDLEKFKFVDKIYYKAQCNEFFWEHEVDYIFLLKENFDEDQVIEFNEREVQDVAWVGKDDLQSFMDSKTKQGQRFTPWFEHIRIRLLLNNFWNQVIEDRVMELDPKIVPVRNFNN